MASTVWRGHLTFGLISIPVRLFRAARPERVPLKRVARVRSAATEPEMPEEEPYVASPPARLGKVQPLARQSAPIAEQPSPPEEARLVPVRQGSITAESSAVVTPSSITRAFQVAPNRFVEVAPEELKKLAPKTSEQMGIQEFVSLNEIDPVYFETSYYVIPEEVGEKAYSLLYQALQKTKLVAVAELAMHSRSHVVIVRPGRNGLVAHTMFYSAEVHADEEFHATRASVSPAELELAQKLVMALETTFDPDKYKDTYRESLETLIAGKMAGTKPEPVAEPEPRKKVVDIADALRASLSALKKPATKSASTPAKKTSRGSA